MLLGKGEEMQSFAPGGGAILMDFCVEQKKRREKERERGQMGVFFFFFFILGHV